MPPPPDRLSALDAAFLDLETARAPLHVGWTMRFDGSPPSLSALRRHVDARLGAMPRFRRRVVVPALGLGDPHWIDDAGFDIARHVHSMRLAPPAGTAELRELAGVLLSTPLDPQRPLWRLQLLTGLDGGFAVVGQAHHALVDGLAAVELAMLLLTAAGPAGGEPIGAGWSPARAPATVTALAAALRARAAAFGAVVGSGPPDPGAVLRGLNRSARAAPQGVGAIAAIAAPAPSTMLDRSITRDRRVAFAAAPLDELRDAARRHSATLNDMLLAAATVAVGAALRRRGEQHDSVRALVPASTRAAGEEAADHGNRISFLALDLPVGEPDLARTIRIVRARSSARKHSGQASAGDALLRAADVLPAAGRRRAARTAAGRARFSVVVSNVPGPTLPLELLGRPLEGAWPAVPLLDGHALTIGAVSYEGRLFAGIYADAEVVPDAAEVARDLERALVELLTVERVTTTPWRTRARLRREALRTAG